MAIEALSQRMTEMQADQDKRLREAAEALVRDAKKREAAANVAERQTAKAGGMFGRSASLRTIYIAAINDPLVFGGHVWTNHRVEYETFLQDLADRLVHNGARTIPGVTITEEHKVV